MGSWKSKGKKPEQVAKTSSVTPEAQAVTHVHVSARASKDNSHHSSKTQDENKESLTSNFEAPDTKMQTTMQDQFIQAGKKTLVGERLSYRKPTRTLGLARDWRKKHVVAVISIGRSQALCAFSLSVPVDEFSFKSCVALHLSETSDRVPVNVLLHVDRKLDVCSFGYDAEITYQKLGPAEKSSYYLFKGLPAAFLGGEKNGKQQIEDVAGRTLQGTIVLEQIIKWLKEKLVNLITNKSPFQEEDILWVFPIPGSWPSSSENILRSAVEQTGISPESTAIVSEQTAIIPLFERISEEDILYGQLHNVITVPGTKFVLTILESEGIDITLFERLADGSIRTLQSCAHSMTEASLHIQQSFNQFLIKLFGADVFMQVHDDSSFCQQLLDLELSLGRKVVEMSDTEAQRVVLRIPIDLVKELETVGGITLKEAVDCSPFKGKVRWSKDKLRIDVDVFKGFLQPHVNGIIEYLIRFPAFKETDTVIMVGDLLQFPILQDEIVKAFEDRRLLLPQNPDFAIAAGSLKWGVRSIMGHQASV